MTAVAETHDPASSSARWAAQVSELALPTKKDEAWRYAPLAELARLTFGAESGSNGADIDAAVARVPTVDGPVIVVVNGVVDHERSDLDGLEGLTITTIGQALSRQPELIAAHFDADDDGPADAFVAMNLAFGRDGAVISVAENCTVDRPVHVVDIVAPGQAQNAFGSGVVIDVGASGSATIVETRLGAGSDFGGSNVRTSVTLAAGATLDHIVIQDLPAGQINLSRVEVTQAADSTFEGACFNIGGAYGRMAYHVELAGDGARAELSGLYFGRGKQTLDQQITVVHAAPGCTSRQSFRGVLDDESSGVFNGGIDVRPGADGTDAEQSNDNILLSRRADVNTQPRLEILADEVACKHGATVGQLDEEALYYMRSRGIPADEAQRLLVEGFADQVVDDVEIESVRSWIIERLGHEHA